MCLLQILWIVNIDVRCKNVQALVVSCYEEHMARFSDLETVMITVLYQHSQYSHTINMSRHLHSEHGPLPWLDILPIIIIIHTNVLERIIIVDIVCISVYRNSKVPNLQKLTLTTFLPTLTRHNETWKLCLKITIHFHVSHRYLCCEAQARVRQGFARDGSQGERPQSFNPCLELTLKLVATHHHQKSHFT